jgi:hypothetical protein
MGLVAELHLWPRGVCGHITLRMCGRGTRGEKRKGKGRDWKSVGVDGYMSNAVGYIKRVKNLWKVSKLF